MDTEKSLIAERAAEWLEQLEHAGPDERARFVKWLKESPQHGWEILLATSTNIAAKQLMKEAGFKATNTEGQPANLLSMDPRRSRAPKTESPQLRSWSNMLIGRRLVAVIAFLAITSLVAIAIQAVSERTISTGPGEWRNTRLADGSVLVAGPRTKVRIDMTAHQRFVRLTHGEVMVYVARDPARPFYVETDLATARAVGTAFAMRLVEPGSASVTVQEGIVTVTRGSASTPVGSLHGAVMLNAGEGLIVTGDSRPLTSHAVDVKSELAWVQRQLIFNANCTIADAIRQFNLRNRTQIKLLDSSLGERPMRGVFSASDPSAFAKTLERSFPLSVVEENDTLLLIAHPGAENEHSRGR